MIYLPRPARRKPTKSIAEEYGDFAKAEDIHALAGRDERKDRSRRSIEIVLEFAAMKEPLRVADIGCGDGTLLKTFKDPATHRFGLSLTEIERDRLVRHHGPDSGIDFRFGPIEELKYQGEPFDLVVFNNAVHILGTENRVLQALRVMASLLRPGGVLVLGEVPSRPVDPKTYTSVLRAWRYVQRIRGNRYALAYARFLWRHRNRWGKFMVPRTRRVVTFPPGKIADLAARTGFAVERTAAMFDLTGDSFYSQQDRMTYRLRKIAEA